MFHFLFRKHKHKDMSTYFICVEGNILDLNLKLKLSFILSNAISSHNSIVVVILKHFWCFHSHSLSNILSLTLSITYTLSPSLKLSVSFFLINIINTQSHSLSLSLSLTHTHTHTQSLFLYLF